MIVVVILHEDWIQVSKVKSTFHIVVRGRYYAERKLFFTIEINIIFLIVVFFIFVKNFLNSFVFLFFWLFKVCQFNHNIASVSDIVNDFSKLYWSDMHTFGYPFDLKIVDQRVSLEITIFDHFIDWNIEEIFVLVSFNKWKELQRLVGLFEQNQIRLPFPVFRRFSIKSTPMFVENLFNNFYSWICDFQQGSYQCSIIRIPKEVAFLIFKVRFLNRLENIHVKRK